MISPYVHGEPLHRRFDPASINWSVAGQPAQLEWEPFTATAPGGYGQFTAKAKPQRGVRLRCWQGDIVEGRRPDGQVVYQGKLMAPPKYVDDVAQFTSVGPRNVVDRYNQRLPYQIRDASLWQELHADPAHFSGNSAKFAIAQKGSSVGVVVGQGQTYALNDNQGYYLWVQGWSIANVQFTLRKSANNSSFDLRVRGSDDAFTAPTTITTKAMASGGDADGTSETISFSGAEYSIAVIDWNANGAASPNNQRFWADDVRVGVITDQDTFTTSDVATDVAQRCGYAVSATGGVNVLPLDWNAPATDLLNYMADIEDATWLVLHNPDGNKKYGKLYFRDFGRSTWHTELGAWAEDEGLELMPLYDRVTTMFENPPGVQQQVRTSAGEAGLRDPLPGESYDYPDIMQLEDPQADGALASAINAKMLARLTTLRVQGSVRVRFVREGVPWDILPGDNLVLGDFQPTLPAQRIAAVTYNKDGSVTCSLERDVRLTALLDHLSIRRLRRRNRRR